METSAWNQVIALLPGAHLLQTSEWGQVKARYGWQPFYLVWEESQPYRVLRHPTEAPRTAQAAALVLERTISLGGFATRLRVLYTPKGPLLDWGQAALRQRVLADLRDFAHRRGAIFIKIDADVLLGTGIPGTPEDVLNPVGQTTLKALQTGGWRFSEEQIQYRNTMLIDLKQPAEELLARMKQKTRYNIRLAERKGVTMRVATREDIPLLYRMYAETSLRDGFVIRAEAYYRTVFEAFMGPEGHCEPLLAEVEGEPVAAVAIFRFAGQAIYLYGMSRDLHRDKMPNYLLQWEAIRRAQAAGCTVYDLWGAPDEFDESDSMWGVYRFKEGLGAQVTRHLGAWDFAMRPWLFQLYTQVLPRILDRMRRRGKERTRNGVTRVG
jgi:peptidoglycan pentaglycine glycine transferase (the first glycine)